MLAKQTKILLKSDYVMVFGTGLLGPLFAVFTEKIGGDILDISWVWATYLIVTGVVIVVVGKISDRKIAKEKFVVAGFALSAALTFGYLLVSTPLHLFFLQFGLGIATAISYPTWDALYANYEDRKHAGYAWGLVDGGEQIIPGIAIIIGGLIIHFFSFQTLFIVMGLIQTWGALEGAKILIKR